MNEKFTRFSSASVGTTTRTDHLRELENAVDKLQKFKNASAINRSYHDANVIPKALGSNRFPIGIYPDLTYKSEFANLINKFQLEILDFNHKHITENIEELENKVSGILDVIGMYDHHIKTKYNIFKSQSESKHKANLTDSMEKFQNTSKKALVHINQDSESIQSEPDISVIDSTNAQPTASHKHQRNKKKNNNINRNNYNYNYNNDSNYQNYNTSNTSRSYNNIQQNDAYNSKPNNSYNRCHTPNTSYNGSNGSYRYNSTTQPNNQYSSVPPNNFVAPTKFTGSLNNRLNFSSQNSNQSYSR